MRLFNSRKYIARAYAFYSRVNDLPVSHFSERFTQALCSAGLNMERHYKTKPHTTGTEITWEIDGGGTFRLRTELDLLEPEKAMIIVKVNAQLSKDALEGVYSMAELRLRTEDQLDWIYSFTIF